MRRMLVGLLVLLVIVVVVLGVMIDRIAKTGIEQGASYALGVGTRVDDVSVSLLRGRLTMDALEVDNPEGYRTGHLMKSGHWELEVKSGSLLTDTVEMPKFELDGLDVNIEWKGIRRNNVSEVMENLKRLSKDEEKDAQKPGKRIRIKSVVIRNVVAHVHLRTAEPLTVKVPVIELRDVTPEKSKGILVSELVGRLFPAVLAGIVDKGKGVLPDGLLKDLSGDIAGLVKVMGPDAAKLVQQVGGDAGKLVEKTLGKLIEDTKDVGKETTDRLKDLLDRK